MSHRPALRPPPGAHATLPATPGTYVLIVRYTARLLGAGGLALGMVILLGGRARFGAAAFAAARTVPGEHLTWGALAAAAGALILTASAFRLWALLTWAQAALGLWCLFFAGGIVIAAVDDPRSGLTGAVVYMLVGLILIVHTVGLRGGRQ